ncbi:hypothetical protein EJ06DRAFT_555331 [Trichodelitschia bisporula]|uniref:Uncharacterized protein n=1 Tax=Trichodelitschia bisporula TaxID=703511 RepID=A0A6G1I108_9PEZI|nr:hypothetical protein EJ06DRAFT_555331 [Trichodelitschia bisporula]
MTKLTFFLSLLALTSAATLPSRSPRGTRTESQRAGPVAAGPVTVIPGPGMPSLASLGVTSEQLFSADFTDPHATSPSSVLHKRQSYCSLTYPASRANAIACRNYLIQTGTFTCSSGPDFSVLCTAGDSEILGWNYYNLNGGVNTQCSDAAVAASWVIDNCSSCPGDSCDVEGSHPATYNSNFVVYVDESVALRGVSGGPSTPTGAQQ